MTVASLRKLIWTLCVVAAAATAAVAVGALKDHSGSIPAYKPLERKISVGTGPGKFDLQGISSYSHIWRNVGGPQSQSESAPSTPGSFNIAKIFKLRSVFLVKSQEAVRGFAAISKGGDENLYSEGSTLPGSYRLALVETDHAVLEKGEARYILPLDRTPLLLTPSRPPTANRKGKPAPTTPREKVVSDDPPSLPFSSSDIPSDKVNVPAHEWDYAVKNLHKILHEVRIQTDLSGPEGGMRGVKIDPRKGSLPYKYGFRVGDVIRAVDGKSIRSIKDIMGLYQKFLKNKPASVHVVFERGGKLRSRNIEIKGGP